LITFKTAQNSERFEQFYAKILAKKKLEPNLGGGGSSNTGKVCRIVHKSIAHVNVFVYIQEHSETA
jgi:hypothetical protein